MKFFTLVGAVALGATALGADSIKVFVDSKPVRFPTGQPMEWNGHVMVPLRGVFEELGATVEWDQAAQMVTIHKESTTIKMTVGQAHALKNEETIVTNVRSILRNGTTYIPLRFLAESLDATVHWEGASRSVHISTTATIPAPSTQRRLPPPLKLSKGTR
jgi:hypothetical protein